MRRGRLGALAAEALELLKKPGILFADGADVRDDRAGRMDLASALLPGGLAELRNLGLVPVPAQRPNPDVHVGGGNAPPAIEDRANQPGIALLRRQPFEPPDGGCQVGLVLPDLVQSIHDDLGEGADGPGMFHVFLAVRGERTPVLPKLQDGHYELLTDPVARL